MIQAGDILGLRGRGFLSRGILAATGYDGHPSPISHVGLFLTGDPKPIVIEALSRVKTNPLSVSLADADKAYVIHDSLLTNDERSLVIETALKFSADDYGYSDIVLQGLDALTHTTWWTDNLAWNLKHSPICSYLVAVAYDRVSQALSRKFAVDYAVSLRLHFGQKYLQSITPADIYRYASGNKAFTITELSNDSHQ